MEINEKFGFCVSKREMLNITRDWLVGNGDDYTHAVTLTFPFEVKDENEADIFIGKFSKRLNKMCNRRAVEDEDKLKMVILFHGLHNVENIHAHCSIRSPNKFNFAVFEKLIKKSWKGAVRNNEAICHVLEYKDLGWIEYSMRQIAVNRTNGISQHCNF